MVREQSYKKPPEEQGFGKKIILDFLDFVRYKVESDSLTMEEAVNEKSPPTHHCEGGQPLKILHYARP